MNRDAALRKLRACLRLAASSNPNEAATALRQAQALMAEYGLTQLDAEESSLGEFSAATRNRGDAPRPIIRLGNAIADYFRCKVLLCRDARGRVEVHFIGPRSSAEVAAYAFIVLRRQMEADTHRHVRRVRKRTNRAARSAMFGIGWCVAIERMLDIRELTEDESRAIDAYMAANHGAVRETEGRSIAAKNTKEGDFYRGLQAGGKARLHSGLTASDQLRLEHAP